MLPAYLILTLSGSKLDVTYVRIDQKIKDMNKMAVEAVDDSHAGTRNSTV